MRFALHAVAAAFSLASAFAFAQTPEVTVTRFDCGTPRSNNVNERFSDTFAFPGLKVDFVFSCYLIKHGNEYMMWDTGYGPTNETLGKYIRELFDHPGPVPDQSQIKTKTQLMENTALARARQDAK